MKCTIYATINLFLLLFVNIEYYVLKRRKQMSTKKLTIFRTISLLLLCVLLLTSQVKAQDDIDAFEPD
jgi:hypothetical protein